MSMYQNPVSLIICKNKIMYHHPTSHLFFCLIIRFHFFRRKKKHVRLTLFWLMTYLSSKYLVYFLSQLIAFWTQLILIVF